MINFEQPPLEFGQDQGNTASPDTSSQDKPSEDQKRKPFFERIKKPVRRLAKPLALLSALSFGVAADSQRMTKTKPDTKFRLTGEQLQPNIEKKNTDEIANQTSKKIVADFPQLGLEGVDIRSGYNKIIFVDNWKMIIQAYEDGYIYYGGKVGSNHFELHDQDEMPIIIKVHGFESYQQLAEGEKSSAKSDSKAPDKKQPINEEKPWWQEEQGTTAEEEEEMVATEGEFAEVADPDDLFASLDLRASIIDNLGPERLAEVEELIIREVPKEFLGRTLHILNLMPFSPALYEDDDVLAGVLEIIVGNFETANNEEGREEELEGDADDEY